ncbi:MAG: glycosyltransferase family 2 protein [Blastocatellales bacterium]
MTLHATLPGVALPNRPARQPRRQVSKEYRTMSVNLSSHSEPEQKVEKASNKRVSGDAPPRGPADPALGGISLVFPVHNESFIIEQTLRNYIAELSTRVPELEVVVAEDGSTDDTKVVLERLEKELPIKLFMSDERKGYQEAVRDAIAHATKPWLFIVDSDYQFAAIDFWRLEPYRKTHDVILGMKCPRKDPFYRVFLSWGYNLLLRMFFKLPYRDMDTGFRLIRRSVAEELAPEVKHLSFFTAEFVVRTHYAGYKILEVPVRHYARKIGSTTIFFVSKLFLICFQQFIGILRMKKEFKRRGLSPVGRAITASHLRGSEK